MPLIPFPSVPLLPGVPPLATDPGLSNALIGQLSVLNRVSGLGLPLALATPAWGVFFLSGQKALNPDSIRSFAFQATARPSDFRQEGGTFETYNKVDMPYQARIEMVVGASASVESELFSAAGLTTASDTKATFLKNVDALKVSVTPLTIVTPDKTYASATIDHYTYRRDSKNGVQLIVVEVWLAEFRVTTTSELSNAQSVSGNDTVNDGQLSPLPASPTQNFTVTELY